MDKIKYSYGTLIIKHCQVKFTLCGDLEIDDYLSDDGVNNLYSQKVTGIKLHAK